MSGSMTVVPRRWLCWWPECARWHCDGPAPNPRSREALQGVIQHINTAAVNETPRGQVKIGCYATPAAELWAQTAEHFPFIQLDIEEGPSEVLSQKVLEGRLDMMISYKVGLPMGLISHELFHASPHVTLTVNHPLASQPTVSLKALEDEPLILLDLPPAGDNTLRLMHLQDVEPRVIHRSTSYETVRSMVARSFGYSLFFQETPSQLSYEGLRIVDVRIDPPLETEPVVLSHNPKVHPTHRATTIRNILTDMFAVPSHKGDCRC